MISATPPASGLPSVTMSGSRPNARVAPPGPAQIVCVSSITSSAPCSRVAARIASWKPSRGKTRPELVSAGSHNTQATSPGASAARSASMSLNGTTRVVSAGSIAGAMFSADARTTPFSTVTSVSSRLPW